MSALRAVRFDSAIDYFLLHNIEMSNVTVIDIDWSCYNRFANLNFFQALSLHQFPKINGFSYRISIKKDISWHFVVNQYTTATGMSLD